MGKLDFGKFIIKNINLAKLFKKSYFDFIKINKSLEKEFNIFNYNKNIIIENTKLNFLKSFKNNFFTLLMISILEKSDIKKERLIDYGMIITLLRTIITCTDNMIDQESKGVIFLKNINNEIVNNTMLLMSSQQVLSRILLRLGDTNGTVLNFLLEKIYSIAESEGLRERDLYSDYPTTKYIVDEVHSGIGGELLQLSLHATIILEKDNKKVKSFNQALYHIGLSLQAIDDLYDMEEDYLSKKINLGISKLLEEDLLEENLLDILSDDNLKEEYNEFYVNYTNDSIKKALEGFQLFASLSYPIDRASSINLMKILFDLRGLKDLWDISSFKND